MDSTLTVTINGQKRAITTEADRSLLEVLREDLHLTGTHFGCGEGDCGACTVHIDGKRAFSCQTAMSYVDGKSITTIEGLANGEVLHPVQQAFMDAGAFQCGYCTSGMVMAACALLKEKPAANDAEIKEWMNTNLCRCCGYPKIMNAIRSVVSSSVK